MNKISTYTLNKCTLKFHDKELEATYKNLIITRTLTFNRIAWGLAAFAVIFFAIIDSQEFINNESLVLQARLLIVALSLIVITISFTAWARRFYDKTAALFIFLFGLFSCFLTVISNTNHFSPYFFSFFFTFAGMFATAGLGFRFSLISMTLNLVFLEIAILLVFPVTPRLQILYSFFLPTGIIIFSYAGFIIEHISRKNFVTAMKLEESIEEIKKLHGLLPICSNCNMIRDDKGYWNKIEEYFKLHSHVSFTHSICPDCSDILYPELKKEKN